MLMINSYYSAYLKYLISGKKMDYLICYFRKIKISIGDCCNIYSDISSAEPYLITIGNNVTISTKVSLVTHDNSVSKFVLNASDVFGRITIGDNCFIGTGSIILPGVIIGDNTIIAAGSVVTKSFSGNCIIGGNPAREISKIESYVSKIATNCFCMYGLDFFQRYELIMSNQNKLIKK